MASISYYLRQDNRSNGTNLWYGKVFVRDTVDLNAIAERIQQNCSMKKSDVLAYLTELIEVIGQKLEQGYKVQMGDIGVFYLGLKSKGAMTKKEFTTAEFVKGIHVGYQTVNKKVNGKMTRSIISPQSFVQIPYPYLPKTPATPNP